MQGTVRTFLMALFLLLGLCSWHALAAKGETAEKRHSLIHNGLERTYLVRLPPSSKLQKKFLPLVLVLHGGGGNALNAEKMTGFTAKAKREGFVVAYPEGTSRVSGKLLTWNAGHCCGYAMKQQVDDVGFISRLIDQMIKEYGVDPQRVYVTGMSNGGMMAHRIGRELSTKVAAIAPVVAGLFGDEPLAASPVPILIFNGALDASVPMAGGAPGGRASFAFDGSNFMPAEYQGSHWAKANGCAPSPKAVPNGRGVHLIDAWYYDCPKGQDVLRYLVLDNGHAWPGGRKGSRQGDEPSRALDATDKIWTFFAHH